MAHDDDGLVRIQFANACRYLTHRYVHGAIDRCHAQFDIFADVEQYDRFVIIAVQQFGGFACSYSFHGSSLKAKWLDALPLNQRQHNGLEQCFGAANAFVNARDSLCPHQWRLPDNDEQSAAWF